MELISHYAKAINVVHENIPFYIIPHTHTHFERQRTSDEWGREDNWAIADPILHLFIFIWLLCLCNWLWQSEPLQGLHYSCEFIIWEYFVEICRVTWSERWNSFNKHLCEGEDFLRLSGSDYIMNSLCLTGFYSNNIKFVFYQNSLVFLFREWIGTLPSFYLYSSDHNWRE